MNDDTATLDRPQTTAPAKPEPKVEPPHPWAGLRVFYWREVRPGVIGALPAMLLEPTRALGGWNLNFWRRGSMQGRERVQHAAEPKAGAFTFPPGFKPPKVD